MTRRHLAALFAGAVLLSVPIAAFADSTIYKIRAPDGRIVYSQDRSVGGKLEDVLKVPSPPAQRVEQARRDLLEDRRQATALEAQRLQRTALDGRPADMPATPAAPLALIAGAEPLPGERIGIAGGGSRLTEAYLSRQQLLSMLAGPVEPAYADAGGVRPMIAVSGR